MKTRRSLAFCVFFLAFMYLHLVSLRLPSMCKPFIHLPPEESRITAAPKWRFFQIDDHDAGQKYPQNPLVDITLRHDFVGAGHNGLNQGQLRNPDNPDKLLDSAAADKIRHYRAPYRQNRHVASLPACMTTSGRIHGEFLRLLYFISNKQAVESSPWRLLPPQPLHPWNGMCPGRCDAWRPLGSASPRRRTSQPTALSL